MSVKWGQLQLHKPSFEKRMVVILREDGYDAWLQAKPDHSQAFLRQFPAEKLVASGPEAEGGLL